MKLLKLIISGLFIIGSLGKVYAQSLDSLIQEAYTNNLELQILEKQYESKLQLAPQIAPRPDLEAGLGVFPLPVETRLGAQVTRLSATQMFPKKGMVNAKKALGCAASTIKNSVA